MIAIIDYGVGNIFSLVHSFRRIGADITLTGDRKEIEAADKIILPGVGAFADAAQKLKDTGLGSLVKEQAAEGKPLLGICLGMQMLFERSMEYGLIEGSVVSMEPVVPEGYKVPQIGWNALHFPKGRPKSEIFKNIGEGDYVYFVHSYYGTDCDSSVIATTDYGAELTAAVQKDNVYGLQFHPEKSGDVGLDILRAFCEM
jgi:glutamine amidotransferase